MAGLELLVVLLSENIGQQLQQRAFGNYRRPAFTDTFSQLPYISRPGPRQIVTLPDLEEKQKTGSSRSVDVISPIYR